MDETEENKRRQQRQEMFRRHKAWRDEVEKRREEDRVNRNMAKERQIQLAEEWQVGRNYNDDILRRIMMMCSRDDGDEDDDGDEEGRLR